MLVEYMGVEIEGTETTLSKDVCITFLPTQQVEVVIENATYKFMDDFTIDQLDSFIVALKTARDIVAKGDAA